MKKKFLYLILTLLTTSLSVFAGNVNLNFYIGSSKIHTESVVEGGTYTLSTIISGAGINMSTYECRDYEFVGWKEGDRISSSESYDPDEHLTITPHDNVSLYAVFHHKNEGDLNGYVRITQTSDLEAGAQYLVVCYYVYGGNQQYYAMTSTAGTYNYEGIKYNRLDADQLDLPHGGILNTTKERHIWTLRGSEGAWKFENTVGDITKWLRIGDTDQTMLVDDLSYASSCAITQANGIFTIRNTANNLILKYVDDYITEEDDYFITGTFSD